MALIVYRTICRMCKKKFYTLRKTHDYCPACYKKLNNVPDKKQVFRFKGEN